ncbi:MAG: hypothetical protein AAFU80_14895 [Pseudomonadota bacterium]
MQRRTDNDIGEVEVTTGGTATGDPAVDVMPARLVTGLITERGGSGEPLPSDGLGGGTTDPRRAIIEVCLRRNAEGLDFGASGDVPVRAGAEIDEAKAAFAIYRQGRV